jgi:hypothetical protein
MNPKVLFVILGLLIVLCVLCTGLSVAREMGFGPGQEGPAATPAWAEAIGDRLRHKLNAEDVSAALPPDCRTQLQQGAFVLSPGEGCLLVIGASSAPVRTLTLRLAQGDGAYVLMTPNEDNRLTEEITLKSDRLDTEVQVFGRGGTLEVQCQDVLGTDCMIEVR